MQRSESFLLSALLSFSGGLQDAYTYNVRGKVFANAQTGNVVLMSQNLMCGQWHMGLYYLCPLVAFSLGVFTAQRIDSKFRNSRRLHWQQIVLLIEIAALTLVGFLPDTMNMAANVLVSYACAMQVQAFRTVHGYGYASTMCIGNLRSGTESLAQYLHSQDPADRNKALYLFGIIAVFAVGAGLGGVLSSVLGIRTIWISVVVLFAVALLMMKED